MKNVLILLLTLIAAGAFAQGSIRGTVVDNDQLLLPGASVFIESLNKGAVTDDNGLFTLVNVPAGSYDLNVSYIGYQPVTATVSVADGQTSSVAVNMESGVDLGVDILVLGDRLKGQAKAINQQKNNLNITNIVAADQIGRFPDANIGDAVKRIPGITMQGDQGEARNIIIRGLAPQLNSVTINGERIPSAEGDNRNIQMDLIPSDMIQTIEVNKAVTPDMDADAIGGSVNLVTRAAPSGMRLSATAASGMNFLTEKPIWTGALVYGNRFANDKIGLVLSGSYNDHDFGSDNIEGEWDNEVESPLSGDDIEVDPYMSEMDIRTYLVRRVRRSVSANLDFKLDNNNTIFVRSMYNWRDDWENRFRTTYRNIEPIFQDGTENILGWQGEMRQQTKGGIDNDRVKNRRLEDQRVINTSLSGDHLFGKVRMNWMATYSRASEDRPNERYIRYEIGDPFDLTFDMSDQMFPLVAPKNADLNNPSNFEFDELTEQNQNTFEQDLIGRLNFELPVVLGRNSGSIKVGGAYRDKTKERNNADFYEYSPLTDQFDTMDGIANEDVSKDNFLPGDQYDPGFYATPEALGQLDLANTAAFEGELVPSEYVTANYNAKEQVAAGYLMWTQNLSDELSAILGVRVESTSTEYTANRVEDEENVIEQITASNNYLNVLPGLHLRYNPVNNLVVRAAWTNTLARPNYFDLAPYKSILTEDEEISEGNPNLEPTTSMNIDLSVENYFKSIGLVSAGIFYKDINDFIYVSVDEKFVDPVITGGDEWTRFQPLNGGDATLLGFEVAFQRQLDFLPGALKGLGVYLNYTYTSSSTESVRNEDGELRDDLALPGTAPHMFNASLSYETNKLVLRASVNYAHEYVDEVGGSDFSDRWYDRQFFLDVNGSYAITKNLRIFAEGNNLTNQPLRYFQGVRERTMQLEYYNARVNVGLKLDLN